MKEENRNIVRFLLNEKPVTVDFTKGNLSPTLTALNYLRSHAGLKGVKEGCAEGDCGACTIVVAEPDHNGLKYKAMNSCLLLLPAIHGTQLITVEGLAVKNGSTLQLHPVQQAMVDLDGSQCGYCTPGIVMSLFALYKQPVAPSESVVKEALAGNLCRCTGYNSILKAALHSCTGNTADHFFKKEEKTLALLKNIRREHPSVNIQTPTCSYYKPASPEELFDVLNEEPDATVVCGSTDIALLQTKKFEPLGSIIDLSGLEELKFIKSEGSELHIGACLPLEELATGLPSGFSALSELLKVFASRQIRNVATLGGNIATASPIGDSLPLLFAYDAKIKLFSREKERLVPVEKFITGYRKTDLQSGECIHTIIIPFPGKKRVRFYKVSKRKDVDIATVSAGFSIAFAGTKISEICLAFGGMAALPKRAAKTERYLLNNGWNERNVTHAAEIIGNEFTPISDARSGAGFRKTVAGNLLIQFFHETADRDASA